MSSLPVFVGLDYHQDSIQVCVVNGEGKVLENRSVENEARLVERVSSRQSKPKLCDAPKTIRLSNGCWEEPGVGLITAVTLRAEVGRFDRFNSGKQLARFCGVTPRNASSGARQADAGLIKAGNPALRVVLIELAHRLINRAQGPWSSLAYKMLQKGKPKNVVVAAIANRWTRIIYHEMKPSLETSAPVRQKGSSRGVSR